MHVMTVPINRNANIVRWLFVSNEAKNSTTDGLCSRSSSLPAVLSITSDRNMKATPKMKSLRFRLFLMYISSIPMKKAGNTTSIRSTL